MKLLRMTEVKAVFGYRSNSSIYSLINEGLFPRPVSIQKRSVSWPDNEVKIVCAARVAGKSEDELRELVQQLHSKRINALDLLGGEV
jgi:prophage regulatory protein